MKRLSDILESIEPSKVTLIKTDRVMLHVEPMKDGGLRVTYSEGFLNLKGLLYERENDENR